MKKLNCLSKISFSILITTIFFTATSTLANSQPIRLENPTCRLEVEHLSGKIHFDDEETIVTPDRPAKLRLTRGTAVDVWITDNNPLIFSYDDKVVLKDSQDYTVFKKLKSSLTGAFKALRLDGAILTLLKSLCPLDRAISDDPKINVGPALIALININSKIEKYVNSRTTIIDKTIRSPKGVQEAKDDVNNWNLETISTQITDKYEILFDYVQKYKESPLTYEMYLALDKENDLKQIISDLKNFALVVNKVHTGIKLENTIETTDTRKVYQLTITVEPNLAYSKLLSKTALKARHDGKKTIKLNFEREAYVRYAIAAGAVYSFVESPSFSVKEDSEGNRTISQSSDDYKEFGGAVMLNIIPERLFESNFEPFLQLGASADGDSIGLLLGAGFSLFSFPNDKGDTQRSLTLSGGIIWQQVDTLASGLSVGDEITTDSELKTDEEFDNGLYLMLGINF